MVLMQKASLVEAKAHLSTFVDQALHHGRGTLILRHGKPVAAIVPLAMASSPRRSSRRRRVRLSSAQVEEMFAALGSASPQVSAVDDLIASRR